MRYLLLLPLLLLLPSSSSHADQSRAEARESARRDRASVRSFLQPRQAALRSLAADLRLRTARDRETAYRRARQLGLATRDTGPHGQIRELQQFVNGRPEYYLTLNLAEAEMSNIDLLWPGGSAGLSLSGAGVLLGIWEGGKVRTTHQEFGGRVELGDTVSTLSDHATHVAGTMIASGLDAGAKGMSHAGNLLAHDWNYDAAEMATAAANRAILASNHSYGFVRGWYVSDTYYWYGDTTLSQTEDYAFGLYTATSATWDNVAWNAPYYLIVKAAGNDRSDWRAVPPTGHWIWGGETWVYSTTIRDTDGGPDGYDCLNGAAVSKNGLVVGAVYGIVGRYSSPTDVAVTNFSDFGPTDDGRIKPDLVADGSNVRSTVSSADDAYAQIFWSGTSMASPVITGTLGLLVQHYRNTHGGETMLASTLKAVVLNSTLEAGPANGPDYIYGWGLLDGVGAAALITADDGGAERRLVERTLANSSTETFAYTGSGDTIRVTLCWTDTVPTVPAAALNARTKMLVNDLDLRVSLDGGAIFLPWRLDVENPASAATQADNDVDNVEQVLVPSAPAGNYTITVSHKGTLVDGPQVYSLVVSGLNTAFDTTGPNAWYLNDTASTGDRFTTGWGYDTNTGRAPGRPLRTLSALEGLLSEGDSVYIDAGVYPENDSFVVETNAITIQGADSTLTLVRFDDATAPAYRAIHVRNASHFALRDIAVSGGWIGIRLANADTAVLARVRADSNGGSGIVVESGSSGVVVTQSAATGNGGAGFALDASPHATVTGNAARSNGASGFDLAATESAVFVQNIADSNAGWALRLTGAVSGCTFRKNSFLTSPYATWRDSALFQGSTLSQNVDVTRNWWGSTDSAVIRGRIGGSADSIALAIFSPYRLGVPHPALGTDTVAPRSPDTLTAAPLGSNAIALSWARSTTNEEPSGGAVTLAAYRLYRAPTADTSYWLLLATLDATADSTIDHAVSAGETYAYRITSLDAATTVNEGFYSDSIATAAAPAVTDTSVPNVWYVNDSSTTGDRYTTAIGADTNDGLARATPLRTLNALEGRLTAGDTVYVDAGWYYENDTVTVQVAGVVLAGAESTLTIIRFDDATQAGRRSLHLRETTGILVQDLAVTGGWHGILLENADAAQLLRLRCDTAGSHGLSIESGTQGALVLGVEARGNAGAGIHVASSNENRFLSNLAAGNTTGFLLETASGNYFAQNTLDSNAGWAIHLSGASSADTFTRNNIATSSYASWRDSGAFNVSTASTPFNLSRNWWGTTDSAAVRALVGGSTVESTARLATVPYRLGSADTAPAADTTAPRSPDSVTATPLGSSSLRIQWSPVSTNEEGFGGAVGLAGYRVYRSSTPETTNWMLLGQVGAGTTSYTDNGLAISTAYYYRVTGFDAAVRENQSFYSDSTASATTLVVDTAGPNTWYVNDTSTVGDSYTSAVGNDGNHGLLPDKPLRTLNAVEPLLSPGDTVLLDVGWYYEADTITLDDSGVAILGVDSSRTVIRFDLSTRPAYRILLAQDVAGIRIADFRITNGYDGIVFRNVDSSTVSRVRSDTHTNQAIGLEAGSNGNRIESSYFCGMSSSSFVSADIRASESNTLVDLVFTSSQNYAMYFEYADSLLIENCRFTNHAWGGIMGGLCTGLVIRGCTIANNASDPLFLFDLVGGEIRNNTITSNQSTGLYVGTADRLQIVGNRITGSDFDGMSLTISNNVITDNIVTGNGGAGLSCSTMDSSILLRNVVSGNAQEGVAIYNGSNNLFSQNTIDSNGDWAIALYTDYGADTFEKNNILPSPYASIRDSGVRNWSQASLPIDFARNWWGTTDSAAIHRRISGATAESRALVRFLPFRLSSIDTTLGADSVAPRAPDSVAALALSPTSIRLSWSTPTGSEEAEPATNLAGFRIYRSPTSDTTYWVHHATVDALARSLDDVGLPVFDAYAYRVTAFDNLDSRNESFYSDSIVRATETMVAHFAVSGTAPLQARPATGGCTLTLSNGTETRTFTTVAGDTFSFWNVPAGDWTLRREGPGHLRALATLTLVGDTDLGALPALLAGEANDDGRINVLDGSVIHDATARGVFWPPADIDGDSDVDASDLAWVRQNFGR